MANCVPGRKSQKTCAIRKEEGLLTHFTLLGKQEAMGLVKCQGGTPDVLTQVQSVCSRTLWSHMDIGKRGLGLYADSWQSRRISKRAGRKGEKERERRREAMDGWLYWGRVYREQKNQGSLCFPLFSQPGREQDDCTHNVVRPTVYLSVLCLWCVFISWWGPNVPTKTKLSDIPALKAATWVSKVRVRFRYRCRHRIRIR